MRRHVRWDLGSEMQVERVAYRDGRWVLSASGQGKRLCPRCGEISKSRHSRHVRELQDLPTQGEPVVLHLQVARWRCRNKGCEQKTFVERLAAATPFARRTKRVADLVRVFAHAAGGLVSERLLARLALSVSDNTIFRHLTRHVAAAGGGGARIVGIDDWSQRKGASYGTIIVDLERRTVLDVLPGRTIKGTAQWLERHPEIEIISRDRCGLFARAAREAAPSARQVADRFHLLKNLRDAIETQMAHVSRFFGRSLLSTNTGDKAPNDRQAQRDARRAAFERVQLLREAGMSFRQVARETGVGWRTVAKWDRSGTLDDRRTLTLKPSSPRYFEMFLSEQWEAGNRLGRHLFHDIKHRGYTGSYSHLERLLSSWRHPERAAVTDQPSPAEESRATDPLTGWQISPIVAASLCVKPTPMLTPTQAAKVRALKRASPSFVAMRSFAMRFRGILRGRNPEKLGPWLAEMLHCGILPLERFARVLNRDLEAVRNAITETASNGQLEGQVNRLKTLKRSMYGRAGVNLLRARLMPIEAASKHAD